MEHILYTLPSQFWCEPHTDNMIILYNWLFGISVLCIHFVDFYFPVVTASGCLTILECCSIKVPDKSEFQRNYACVLSSVTFKNKT